MAYQLSNEIRAQIQKDAEKLRGRNGENKNTSGNNTGSVSNNRNTKTNIGLKSSVQNNGRNPAVGGYQLSEEIREQIRIDAEKLRNRNKKDNVGAAALDDAMGVARQTAKTAKTPSTYNPYKSYNQPDGLAANGEAKQTTKAYSDKRLQDEALRLFKEYGGKSYTEIQGAIAQNTGDDYMSQYRNQILTQIGQQNRTRADIEREIAETEAELEIAQAEWDAYAEETGYSSTGDNREEYQQHVDRVNTLIGRKEALEGELWIYDQSEMYSAVPGYSDFGKNSGVTGDGKGRVYHFINDTYGEKSAMREYGPRAGQGADTSFMPYLYMTDDEIGVYNYLYNVSGKEAAAFEKHANLTEVPAGKSFVPAVLEK